MGRVTRGGHPVWTHEERAAFKLLVDAAARLATAKKEIEPIPIIARDRSVNTALMTEQDMAIAYRSYVDGMDIDDLAASCWRRYGYQTVGSCRRQIVIYFRKRGWIS